MPILSLSHDETDSPSLLREKTWKIPGTSGLNRLSADELLITYHEGVSVFRIPTESFAPFAPLANVENVKSVNYDPLTQCLVYSKPEINWWTRHIYWRNPDRTVTFPGINLYKARVTSP